MAETLSDQGNAPQKDLETCIAETRVFTQGVVDKLGLKFNPDPEVNETIVQGLARHQHQHGKRYCPCFLIQGDRKVDRICPCKPGLKEEIPRDGHCHCGIFCAPDFNGLPYEPSGE